MAGTKRSISPGDSPDLTGKRARHFDIIEPYKVDDDDDLDSILTRIKEQEQSERLAKQLQDEWNASASSSTDLNASDIESDAALAKRLSMEWNQATPEVIEVEDHSSPEASTPSWAPTRRERSIIDSQSPGEKLALFKDIYTAKRNCTKCGEPVTSPRGFVVFSTNETLPPSLAMLLHAPCSSCRTNHCRGCFRPLDCPVSCKGQSKNSNCAVESCCIEGRAIAIFEAVGGFDRQYLGERATAESRAQAAISKRKSAGAKSVGPGGTGYGADGGYGDEWHVRRVGRSGTRSTAKPSQADELAAHWEVLVARSLETLARLLPNPSSETAQEYDFLPHPSIPALLSLSQLPVVLGDLLRNDSVSDWISRSGTYYAMIALLRRMADCELTVQVLIEQRREISKSCGVESWMWDDGDITWVTDRQGIIERAPPLYEYFKKLTKQCEAFLAGASHVIDSNEDGEDMEEILQGTSLCGDIIASRDDMERAMSILGVTRGNSSSSKEESIEANGKGKGKGKGKTRDIAVDLERAYFQACEKLAYKHVEVDRSRYNYISQLQETQSSTRNPKDRLHVLKELAVLATSLPPGVWVRIDEVRNDCIKIMIAGPDQTPYAGGLFEFDCFLPIQYPNTPPLMHLRTTGGGTVRFNPNLYNCGKVCLSLLGTWAGRPEEQWSPGKSTLLQVLVSIQSMIFIDAPYFNEPGMGRVNLMHPQSVSYNKDTSVETTRWAIVDWLREEHKDGIWRDVIASHFSLRQEKIRKQIIEWSTRDPRIQSYSGVSYANVMRGKPKPNLPQHGTGSNLLNQFDEGLVRIQDWTDGDDS